MTYRKLKLICFSPTGTTMRILKNISEGLGISDIEIIDITDFDTRWLPREFSPDELVLIGMPVYAGRIPAPAALYFKGVKSDRSPCVPVVVYGNRAYEDALLELKNITEECGFGIIAAAAFVAEHSLCADVATGRPNSEDAIEQAGFGRKIIKKLKPTDPANQQLSVPGSFPYKKSMDLPFSPEADESCTLCGNCVLSCPVRAIDPRNPSRTDSLRCILCGACVKVCPLKARKMSHPSLENLEKAISRIGNERKSAEIFI